MAMILGGLGSLVAHEIGKVAVDHLPFVQQVAKSAVVDIAKKSFDLVLSQNPNLASFLGNFGITSFNKGSHHSTLTKRGRHRRITYMK